MLPNPLSVLGRHVALAGLAERGEEALEFGEDLLGCSANSAAGRERIEEGAAMRFLFMLVLIAACIVGLGFYRGWFHVTSDNSADTPNVTVTVDKDKIQQDRNEAQQKVQDLKQK